MIKPRTKNGGGIKFPYIFEKNGRTGRIKKWGDGKFGTYFMYAGQKRRNSFGSFEAAYEFLDREFSKLDTDSGNSLTLFPIQHDVKTYHELEHILREQGNGATLKQAVEFFLAHYQHKRFQPKTVEECIRSHLENQRTSNLSRGQIRTLEYHFRQFEEEFGSRKIHEVSAEELTHWLASRKREGGKLWSAKTRRNIRGSLVSLSLYAQSILNAIPDVGKTQFQRIKNPRKDARGAVEIYTVDQVKALLLKALECDLDLIPAIVVGCFEGLRPDEFHAEGVDRSKRKPLGWDNFNWNDKLLHVIGQKVRSKATRDIPLHTVAQAWLAPFKSQAGEIWRYKKAFDDKMRSLFTEAKTIRIYDGFRHSYASYRIRQLKCDLAALAAEMGNSPTEIINSYKRNVTDAEAEKWFNIMPPVDYAETVKAALELRQTS